MNSTLTDYEAFIKSKTREVKDNGFQIDPDRLNRNAWPWQRLAVSWALRRGRCALFEECGLGKGQPLSSPVLTPDGWRPIGTLTVGDEIIASDGRAHTVTGVYPKPAQPTHRVHFSDGTSFVVDEDHLHIVRTYNDKHFERPWRVMSTKELLAARLRYGDGGKSRMYSIPTVAPVQGFRTTPLPLSPYLLGFLLGDGTFATTSRVGYTCAEPELQAKVAQLVEAAGGTVRHTSDPIGFAIGGGRGNHPNPILEYINQSGLAGLKSGDKFIPPAYLLGTVEDRLELLRGLMDTDGYIKDTSQHYTVSPRLHSDVLFLLRSLGACPTSSVKATAYRDAFGDKQHCQPCHTATFSLKGLCPFSLQRKADLWNPNPRDNGRWIDRIEFESVQPTVCISVDSPDQSYVTEHFIVTHNTFQQLMWGEQVVLHERRPVLLLCPIGVRPQTCREAERFGIGVPVLSVNDGSEVRDDAVNVTNYEKLHKFDTRRFGGVILDESQVLKEFKSKTKRDLCERFKHTPYRLACTATPSPNEYMELGCHSEFLGVMPSNEMLSRWFINDAMRAGEYRLLSHAADDFWRWMCGWAMCLSKPSDMGPFSDEGYILPPIEYHYENVSVDVQPADGMLFPADMINVHTMHVEKRQSCESRAAKAAEIVASDPSVPWIVWCDTDYEADALGEAIPAAVEVRGSMTERKKEDGLASFSDGRARIIITKPEIGGLGLNWAHCANVVFVGLSYSFERFYQAVRRSWRFGQRKPVNVWVIQSDAEEVITRRVLEKQSAHQAMQASLADAMRKTQIELLQGDLSLSRYLPTKAMRIPSWLTSKA